MPDSVLVKQVIEACLWAANGMGQQKTKFIVVNNENFRNELSELNRQIGGWKDGLAPFYSAPKVIVVLGKKGSGIALYDGCLVMGNMMLAGDSLGLGSCWIHHSKDIYETEGGRNILDRVWLECHQLGRCS